MDDSIVSPERCPVQIRLGGCKRALWNLKYFFSPMLTRLKKEKYIFRSEMICRVEEAKHEMESRLDSQRRHMVQKESVLQNEIEELKVSMVFSFPNPLTAV